MRGRMSSPDPATPILIVVMVMAILFTIVHQIARYIDRSPPSSVAVRETGEQP